MILDGGVAKLCDRILVIEDSRMFAMREKGTDMQSDSESCSACVVVICESPEATAGLCVN